MQPINHYVELQPYNSLSQNLADQTQYSATHQDDIDDTPTQTPVTKQTTSFGSINTEEVSLRRKSVTSSYFNKSDDNFHHIPPGTGVEAKDVADTDNTFSVLNTEGFFHDEYTPIVRLNTRASFRKKLGQHCKSNILEISVHIIMGIGALLVLVFAILSASIDSTYPGKTIKYTTGGPVSQIQHIEHILFYPNGSTDSLGDISRKYLSPLNTRLFEIAKIGPTIIPILFAGIFSSTTRLFARWKAEKGSRLETLEMLVGCRSLFSTVVTMFSLGTIGALQIIILCLWVVSPLAGQASLRVLGLVNVTDATVLAPWYAVNYTDVNWTTKENFELGIKYISALYHAPKSVDGAHVHDDKKRSLIPLIPTNETFDIGLASQAPNGFASLVGQEIFGPAVNATNSVGVVPQPLFYMQDMGNLWNTTEPISVVFDVGQYEFICPSLSGSDLNGSWTSMLGPDSTYANRSALVERANSGSGFFLETLGTFLLS
ncbi:hypothetical protein HYFRA_00007012 [Hymenoscyphus fraxineus]|uniref:Uncharacterized protein n=1 Tax=Hymenoscyphus fraxineus TaxID=746836 RepID=A0A9N9KMI3_9HELO|nr:hypothetical protein HYFRA_00007012 [Hymenoscyphus fraxineus]